MFKHTKNQKKTISKNLQNLRPSSYY